MDSKEKLLRVSNELIAYLQEFVTRFEVNESELRQVVTFLTRVGQQDEFQLLLDVLGISVLVDDITHGQEYDGTVHNVEGPFYRADAPLRTILCRDDEEGDILFVSGHVTAAGEGRPLPGTLLDVWQTNRHGWRPSHIHLKVSCPGFVPLTTMLFMSGDPWLQSDAINAVKDSLIVKLEKHESQADMQARGVDRPFYTGHYDFSLNAASV